MLQSRSQQHRQNTTQQTGRIKCIPIRVFIPLQTTWENYTESLNPIFATYKRVLLHCPMVRVLHL